MPNDDFQPKTMKGKYDGRKNNGRYKSAVKRGPKPLWLKHLGRNTASKVLEQFDSIASPAEIYAAAWEKGKLELCAEMYKQFQDRLYGRPFIAENPEKADKANTLKQDKRLQVAIQQLVIGDGKDRPRESSANQPQKALPTSEADQAN